MAPIPLVEVDLSVTFEAHERTGCVLNTRIELKPNPDLGGAR